ncbi:MAG TPA: hypothetical protein VFA24_04740 [Gaiellaceae bacterium]|nr:hypothetical protein [Gaiellaceae bacterium]
MKMRLLGAAAFAALMLAGGAQAKGPDAARVCGGSGCTTVRGPSAVAELLDWMSAAFAVGDTPRTAPYYRFTLRDRGHMFMTLIWVPSRHSMRVLQPAMYPFAPGSQHPYWRAVSRRGAAVLGRAVEGLKPFSAPRAWR